MTVNLLPLMRCKSFLLILCMLTAGLTARSQANYLDGYVITMDHDTVYGLIDYKGERRNSEICQFLPAGSSTVAVYKPFDIESYCYTNGRFYKSDSIVVDGEKRVLFIEYLVDGIVDLLYYADKKGSHFLLRKKDSVDIELTNDVHEVELFTEGKVNPARYYKNTNQYIFQLKDAFKDCFPVLLKLDSTQFTAASLINITSKYHEYVCTDQKCIVYQKKLPPVHVNFGPVAGLTCSFLRMKKDGLYEQFRFNPQINPFIGFLLTTSVPGINYKFSVELEADISRFAYASSVKYNQIYYDIYLEAITTAGKLNLFFTLNAKKVKPVLGLGALVNYSFYQKTSLVKEVERLQNIYTTEYTNLGLDQLFFGGSARVGINVPVSFRRALFFHLFYEFTTSGKMVIQSIGLNGGIYF